MVIDNYSLKHQWWLWKSGCATSAVYVSFVCQTQSKVFSITMCVLL